MSIEIFASVSLIANGKVRQSRSVLGLRHGTSHSMSTDAKIVMKHIQRVSLRSSSRRQPPRRKELLNLSRKRFLWKALMMRGEALSYPCLFIFVLGASLTPITTPYAASAHLLMGQQGSPSVGQV